MDIIKKWLTTFQKRTGRVFYRRCTHRPPVPGARAGTRGWSECHVRARRSDSVARRATHSHPLGQTLIVTAGCGRVQSWGGPIEEIRPGDVIWSSPGEKHWHGAAPTTAVTHVAIQEQLDGKAVDWMDKVSDGQYQAALKAE